MIKKTISLVLALMMILTVFPVLAENAPAPLTAEEITSWAENVKKLALAGKTKNNPADDLTEDGYAFEYDFATLYADEPVLGEDTAVSAIVMTYASGIEDPRGLFAGCDLNTLLAAWPCDDATLPGTRTDAVLYLEEGVKGYSYGRAIRDGQRIGMIEISICEKEADKATNLGLVYTMDAGYISTIRVYGLAEEMAPEAAAENLEELKQIRSIKEYALVPTSLTGSELEPLHMEDLRFAGVDFLSAVSTDFADALDEMWMDNDDGTWLHIVDGDGYHAVFRADANRENEHIASFSILGDEIEGPRAVRLGDSFTDVFYRFRSGDGDYDAESLKEVLYQSAEGEGYAEYTQNGADLRYFVQVNETEKAGLLLHFDEYTLTEITVFMAAEQ